MDVLKRALVLSAVLLLCLGFVPSAGAATIPEVRYTLGGARSLIYVNNPEQLIPSDLGDRTLGNKIILSVTVQPGAHRNWFEHMNQSGGTLGYGVQLYNPNSVAVTVKVHGSGFINNALGGQPWAQMFNNYSTAGTSYTVAARSVLWLLRRDASVIQGNFFSGIVDFTVSGGAVAVHNYAYRSFGNLDGTAQYQGYVRRISPYLSHNEALVYKGTSPYTEAVASNVNFTVSNADGRGELKVSHAQFDLTAGAYTPAYVRQRGWYANIGPAMNANAITSDMISIDTPGWGVISPVTRSDGTGNYPNFGNWAVVYKLRGTITNTGTFARNVSFNLQAPDYACIAYKGVDGRWYEYNLVPNEYIQYSWMSVPATGQPVPYEVSFVLGGPAAGNLFHSVALNN